MATRQELNLRGQLLSLAPWLVAAFGSAMRPRAQSRATRHHRTLESRIAPNSTVLIVVNKSKIGQEAKTSIPMLIAEELDIDRNRVRLEQGLVYAKSYGKRIAGDNATTPTHFDLIAGLAPERVRCWPPLFSMDASVNGMKFAVFQKCPAFGGSVVRVDVDAAREMAIVSNVFIAAGADGLPAWVTGIADNS